MVRAAGLEPALLAKTDFESVASTIPPRPHSSHFLVVTAKRSEVPEPLGPSEARFSRASCPRQQALRKQIIAKGYSR